MGVSCKAWKPKERAIFDKMNGVGVGRKKVATKKVEEEPVKKGGKKK